jgi:hypothetical protein
MRRTLTFAGKNTGEGQEASNESDSPLTHAGLAED